MAHDVGAFLQNVLLIGALPGTVVMDHIGHTVPVPPVRNDSDMLLKNHKIPALPF